MTVFRIACSYAKDWSPVLSGPRRRDARRDRRRTGDAAPPCRALCLYVSSRPPSWANRPRPRPPRPSSDAADTTTDPYERADITSNTYYDWVLDHVWLFIPAQAHVAQMLQTLIEFPARQEPASFNIDQVMAKLKAGLGSS